MKKSFLFVIVVVASILSMSSFTQVTSANTMSCGKDMQVSAEFKDVYTCYENYEAIKFVKDQKIVDGFSDGTFRPYAMLTRGAFTKIVIAANYPATEIDACKSTKFPDAGTTFMKYICIAQRDNIVSGFSNGTYRPDEPITYGAAYKILANTYKVISDEARAQAKNFRPYAEALSKIDALPTIPNRSIYDVALSNLINRGEMVQIIYRLENKYTKANNPIPSKFDVLDLNATPDDAVFIENVSSVIENGMTYVKGKKKFDFLEGCENGCGTALSIDEYKYYKGMQGQDVRVEVNASTMITESMEAVTLNEFQTKLVAGGSFYTKLDVLNDKASKINMSAGAIMR